MTDAVLVLAGERQRIHEFLERLKVVTEERDELKRLRDEAAGKLATALEKHAELRAQLEAAQKLRGRKAVWEK